MQTYSSGKYIPSLHLNNTRSSPVYPNPKPKPKTFFRLPKTKPKTLFASSPKLKPSSHLPQNPTLRSLFPKTLIYTLVDLFGASSSFEVSDMIDIGEEETEAKAASSGKTFFAAFSDLRSLRSLFPNTLIFVWSFQQL